MRVPTPIITFAIVALIACPICSLGAMPSMAWDTTDSTTGLKELCIAFNVGNTTLLMINKDYRVVTMAELTAQDVEDCTRGMKIAKKNHAIHVFSPSDLSKK